MLTDLSDQRKEKPKPAVGEASKKVAHLLRTLKNLRNLKAGVKNRAETGRLIEYMGPVRLLNSLPHPAQPDDGLSATWQETQD